MNIKARRGYCTLAITRSELQRWWRYNHSYHRRRNKGGTVVSGSQTTFRLALRFTLRLHDHPPQSGLCGGLSVPLREHPAKYAKANVAQSRSPY